MKTGAIVGGFAALAGLFAAGLAVRRKRTPVRLPVLLIGDSLAVGLEKPLQELGIPVHSIAVSGTTVAYWPRSSALSSALKGKPGTIFVSLGANDAFLGDAHAQTASVDTEILLDVLEGSGAQVFWIGPPSLPSSYEHKTSSQVVVAAIGAAVSKHPNAIWLDSSRFQISRSADALHPNDAGYARWAALLLEQLDLAFVSPSAGPEGTPASLGADDSDEEPLPRPAPPSLVTVPTGWVHRKQASAPMRAFAVSVLAQRRPIGDLQTSTIDGSSVGALTEWHWDNHVGGEWKWHRGISLLAPAS